jgi:anionic cell wall polymer biosynthesis LytR-Cps2A-Psr (LCP) family protein
MKKQRPSIDGFVPRRIGSQIGELHDNKTRLEVQSEVVDRTLHSGDELREPVGVARPHQAVGRTDIDESLREIDNEPVEKVSRQTRRAQKIAEKEARKSKRSKIWKVIKWLLILAILGVVVVAGYTLYQTYIAGGKIFKGNPFDILTQTTQPLKQDANGRTNILVLGTSEDDPGHPAGNLTDSMMIVSIDQNKKNAYMISIPRDLYVKYGVACDAGYSGKINVYYSCVTEGTGVDAQRAALVKEAAFVGEIFGLDVQYGVNVNYTVFRDVMKAIGGSITVTIESRNPAGQMDSNFDWKCGATYAKRIKNCPPRGHFIDYPNGPATLDAEHALYLAQARGDIAPTYGFEQSNFDREKNQQKILKAIREKAMNIGVLADVGKVTSVISSLGDNLRTTFASSEVRTLVSLAQSIKDTDINSISLIDGDNPVMTTGPVNGQSSVIPSAGTYDYSELQAYIKKSLSADPIVRENAEIAVFNGSGVAGVAQTEADSLKALGLNVTTVATAPSGTYGAFELYQVGTGNTATKAKLESLLGVKAKTTKAPVAVVASVRFVIIIGVDPAAKTTP